MTEAVAVTLPPLDSWHHLGSTPENEPVEVIVRSFDRPVLFAVGASPNRPDGRPATVAPGSGVRLTGLHFFAKPARPGEPCRILVRGL
jgi:hypothetical protein